MTKVNINPGVTNPSIANTFPAMNGCLPRLPRSTASKANSLLKKALLSDANPVHTADKTRNIPALPPLKHDQKPANTSLPLNPWKILGKIPPNESS